MAYLCVRNCSRQLSTCTVSTLRTSANVRSHLYIESTRHSDDLRRNLKLGTSGDFPDFQLSLCVHMHILGQMHNLVKNFNLANSSAKALT